IVDLLLENAHIWQLISDSFDPALRAAAYNGHADIVRALLLAGARVDSPAADGSTALAFASRKGHVGVIEELLDWEAIVTVGCKMYNGSISVAIQAGSAAIVEILLRRAQPTSAQ
ncbi:uncharacterized protein MYCFIDRAFT_124977, partial [Pseudocercospora fijiensis CIRAD86]